MTNSIAFEKVTSAYKEIIFSWLAESHVQEFWDNTQGHKDDILNFMGGRKAPSNYCEGKYIYWIALDSGKPYAMLMTICETIKDDIGELRLSHLSKTGHTYSLDYMIGSTEHIGKGYGAKTLVEFIDFFRDSFDKKADTFLIASASDNPRAKRVYEKTGFKLIANFVLGGDCSGSGKLHHLLIKKFPPAVTLEPAGISDYPMIQNMARFYVYDLSKECGHISEDWRLPVDGLFESFDFKSYFEENSRKAYLVKVYDDVAGFVLLNQSVTCKNSDWNVGEFFVLGKYQGHGVGKIAAEKIWQLHPGKWEVSVIPENISALKFWESTINKFTANVFEKETKLVDFDKDQPKRIIFSFDSGISGLDQKLNITLELAKKLIATQFPEYADLNVREVEQQGQDNRTYRIGNDMLIRMPTAENYALKVPKEQELLPKLAKHLSIAIPAPIKMGKPSEDYPYPFSIYEWLDGRSANHVTLDEPTLENIAFQLANFLKELQAITDVKGPDPGQHNWWRGNHVSVYDLGAREQISNLADTIDSKGALALWERACATKWNKAPVWIHGDFAVGNILIKDNKLSGVIDFGGTAIGDPACDLVIAWTYLIGKAREVFIDEMNLDKDTWLRSRVWALWKATFELCNIVDKNSREALSQKKIISEVINE